MLADASFHEEVANKINQVRSSSEKLPDVEELVEKLIRKLVFVCLFFKSSLPHLQIASDIFILLR